MGNKSDGNFAPTATVASIDRVVTPAPERSRVTRYASPLFAGTAVASIMAGEATAQVEYVGGTNDPASLETGKVAAVAPEAAGAHSNPYGANTPILGGVPIKNSTDPGVYNLQASIDSAEPGEQVTIVTYSQGGMVGNSWQAQHGHDSPEIPKKMANIANPCDEENGVGVVVPWVITAIGAEACHPVYNSDGQIEKVEINRLGDPIGDMAPLNGDLLHDGVVIADAIAGWKDRHPAYDDPALEVIESRTENGVTHETVAKPGDEQAPLLAYVPPWAPEPVREYINEVTSVGDPEVPWAPPPPAPPQPQIIYTPEVSPEYVAPANDVIAVVNGAVGQFGFQVRLPGQ